MDGAALSCDLPYDPQMCIRDSYVNPLDINLNYSEDDSPLALKSDFVLSFCELVMGSKTGLEAIERTVIDLSLIHI